MCMIDNTLPSPQIEGVKPKRGRPCLVSPRPRTVPVGVSLEPWQVESLRAWHDVPDADYNKSTALRNLMEYVARMRPGGAVTPITPERRDRMIAGRRKANGQG